MSELTKTLTESTFHEEILGSPVPVLVDFWAEWCGPCKAIAPALEQIAVERSGSLTVAKVDVDHHPVLAREHQVQSIPTMILFVDGEAVHRFVGAQGKASLLAELDEALART
jgi:thioredoxin 1